MKNLSFSAKNKYKYKNMQNRNLLADNSVKTEYSLVYYYLLTGIALLVAVFLFLPKVSTG